MRRNLTLRNKGESIYVSLLLASPPPPTSKAPYHVVPSVLRLSISKVEIAKWCVGCPYFRFNMTDKTVQK